MYLRNVVWGQANTNAGSLAVIVNGRTNTERLWTPKNKNKSLLKNKQDMNWSFIFYFFISTHHSRQAGKSVWVMEYLCVCLGWVSVLQTLSYSHCDRRFKARRLEGSRHSPDKRSARRLFVFLFIIVHTYVLCESVCVCVCWYHAHMCICESETYRLPLVAYVTQSFMGVPATRRGRSSPGL